MARVAKNRRQRLLDLRHYGEAVRLVAAIC
jgi:hypothetical protein